MRLGRVAVEQSIGDGVKAALKQAIGRSTARGVAATKCRDCRAETLTGIDDDVCAFLARVDSAALSAVGEMLALLGGRETFELRARGAGLALWHRSARDIASRPAGSTQRYQPNFDVVAEHRCGSAALPIIPSRYNNSGQTRKVDENDACPF